jgi:hypothetical protein
MNSLSSGRLAQQRQKDLCSKIKMTVMICAIIAATTRTKSILFELERKNLPGRSANIFAPAVGRQTSEATGVLNIDKIS